VAGSCEQGKLTSGVHKSGNFVVVLFLPAEWFSAPHDGLGLMELVNSTVRGSLWQMNLKNNSGANTETVIW
jgi:hypothetical protein